MLAHLGRAVRGGGHNRISSTLLRSLFGPTNTQHLRAPTTAPLGSVRFFGRRDGNKSFLKQAPPTRKKARKHRRRLETLRFEREGKHSPHGSKMRLRKDEARKELDSALRRARELRAGVDRRTLAPAAYDEGDALLDTLMGSTAHLTAQETPQPHRLHGNYDVYYRNVRESMVAYERGGAHGSNERDSHLLPTAPLPTDDALSLLVRSYRDRHGSRTRPVGVAKALRLLLVDLRVPTSAFGEKTYTSLMTCAVHPKEARRIMTLMTDNNEPHTDYVHSILVHAYAKTGDFRGARRALDETYPATPTLAAYTSLLAACYRVAGRASGPRRLKAEAQRVGWEAWKEMRVVGIDADVMAYGAIVRLCAARGLPERCLNLLDESASFRVTPTTLLFTDCLRAVARSHENALRFEGGYSDKNRRRQEITRHHGLMTREIMIAAEQSEVELDNGYLAALVTCAAAAGDAATAKAVVLASEVRKMDGLRGIGTEENLVRIGGGTATAHRDRQRHANKSLEREYGRDARVHSALLLAFSNSMKRKGLGDLWSGQFSTYNPDPYLTTVNRGYLCERSLTHLVARSNPKYHDNSIPDSDPMTVGFGSMTYEEEDPDRMSKKLRRAKFRGLDQDDDAGNTLDDIPEALYKMYEDVPDKQEMDPDGYNFRVKEQQDEKRTMENTVSIPDMMEGMRQDMWGEKKGEEEREPKDPDAMLDDLRTFHEEVKDMLSDCGRDFDAFYTKLQEEAQEEEVEVIDRDEARDIFGAMEEEEMVSGMAIESGDKEAIAELHRMLETTGSLLIDEELEREDDVLPEDKETLTGSEQETNTMLETGWRSDHDIEHHESEPANDVTLAHDKAASAILDLAEEYSEDYYNTSNTTNATSQQTQGHSSDGFEEAELYTPEPKLQMSRKVKSEHNATHFIDMEQVSDNNQEESLETTLEGLNSKQMESYDINDDLEQEPVWGSAVGEEMDNEPKDELDMFLQGMPPSRIAKVRRVFELSLGTPPLLRLIPLLRENMPPVVTIDWLKKTNMKNARHVLDRAEEERKVDMHVLNGMLQVEATGGTPNSALRFHDEGFRKYGLTPNQYSDRLVVEMLAKKKRIDKAFTFKEKIESEGRILDLLSYGHFVEYHANREQLDLALSLLKESISVHGYPPPERSLYKLRLICRKRDIEEEVGLTKMIGEDPVKWLRDGEANLKREYSKKGNRYTKIARNFQTKI